MQKLSTEWGYAAPAAVDLTGKLNYFGVINSDGEIDLAADGALVVGTITEEAALGGDATLSTGFILKVVAGAAITAGAKVASDGAGMAKTAATGNFIVGVALNSPGAAGVMCEVLVLHAGRAA